MAIDLYTALVIVAGMACLTIIWIVAQMSRSNALETANTAFRVASEAQTAVTTLGYRFNELEKSHKIANR